MEKINQIWRNPRNQFSIENVFKTINQHLIDVEVIVLPHPTNGVLSILKNIQYVSQLRLNRIHVVGDVHYILLVPAKQKILTIHDLYSLGPRKGVRGYVRWILWFYLPTLLADEIVTISEYSRSEISKELLKAKKIHVINNPVTSRADLNIPTKKYDYTQILVIGTKSNKNVNYILKELQKARVTITVVGRLDEAVLDEYSGSSMELINRNNISDDELTRLFEQNSIYISASSKEGFGLPILEAQSHGLLVLANSIEIYKEVGRDSITYFDSSKEGDLLELYTRIVKESLVIDKDLYRQNLERFSSKLISEQYKAIYKI